MKRLALFAVLTNDKGSCYIPSGDWESILIFGSNLWDGPDNRENKDRTWAWTRQEAFKLADALEQERPKACSGCLMIDVNYENGLRATQSELYEDGFTPEQRTKHLIIFLRQGEFRWRFQSQEI